MKRIFSFFHVRYLYVKRSLLWVGSKAEWFQAGSGNKMAAIKTTLSVTYNIPLCFLCPCFTSKDSSTSQGLSVLPHPLPKPVFPALSGHSYIIFHLPLWGGGGARVKKATFLFHCFPIFSLHLCIYGIHFIFCTRVLQTLHLLSFYWEKFWRGFAWGHGPNIYKDTKILMSGFLKNWLVKVGTWRQVFTCLRPPSPPGFCLGVVKQCCRFGIWSNTRYTGVWLLHMLSTQPNLLPPPPPCNTLIKTGRGGGRDELERR